MWCVVWLCGCVVVWLCRLCSCWLWSARGGVEPQLYADNLKCVSGDPGLLLRAAGLLLGMSGQLGRSLLIVCVLMSTSRVVRKDMKDWVLSQGSVQWTVKLDVRDLGGHLNTTLRRWSATLATRVLLVISRLVLVFILPLEFSGRIRVARTMFIPGAVHGIEASLLAAGSLRELRSCMPRVVWSRRQPLTNVGAVLGLLDGPQGCDPSYCIVWFPFRTIREYLACRPGEVGRVYRLLDMATEGCPGHGSIHLLASSAADIGFRWDPHAISGDGPGLPDLSNLASPTQHFRSAVLSAWQDKVAADLCVLGVGFGAGHFLMFQEGCSSSTLAMFGREIRHCLCWLEGFGMVSFCLELGDSPCYAGSAVVLTVMVTCSGSAPFPLLLRFVNTMSFMISENG